MQLSLLPPDSPDGLICHHRYISQAEADALVRWIDAQPWQDDLKRRVQHYGYRYDYRARRVRRGDRLGPRPEPFGCLVERMTTEGHFAALPDQVIVNEYMPGQGISAHVDCQPCFGDTIASLSLLSACMMRFAERCGAGRIDLPLPPRSLLVMCGAARHDWTHGIAARKNDTVAGRKHPRARRLSLTFRTIRLEG
ncbi:alpha-ketoglutarate-dependent dioxygenase AlkB [Marivita sp. GX14005]|uniref:alpha-ketoglutarate-dependent dioxygenase AlkB n=1 Tax=Marivita sp. GX14005 TaxID=2942276 RepID=UPI0020184836|nr:alpha-ketoglutarate-dependent dioxygenase AlkB [Marivita sp. GX14005]MCL3883919.1 alpha-ketoglutarate-dependent dioxygenase AlkB [Marivita sp. GX14005]